MEGRGLLRKQALHQDVAIRRDVLQRIARFFHRLQNDDGAGRCIETDTGADTPFLVGIVRQHHRDLARGRFSAAQLYPIGGEIGDEGDPVLAGARRHDGALRRLVIARRRFPRDRAREDATVEFGECHLHGKIAWG